jgi:hypothetical protein
MLKRFRERRYTPAVFRAGLCCIVAAGVALVQFGSSGADTSSFVTGNAQAQSQALSVAPTTGGLNYAIILATSIAAYHDTEAQALSQTIDLGALGTALEAQGCDGGPPALPPKDVPPPVQVESTDGAQNKSDTITPQTAPGGFGIGDEAASATPQPSSGALTTVADISVPGGVLSVGGLTSAAHSSIDNGNTRTATSTADVKSISLGKGAVVFGGLHWTATSQSGAATGSPASFAISSLNVGGVPVDLSQVSSAGNPQSVLNIVNTALQPLGLNVQWPVVKTLPDGTVEITPLVVGIDNNTLGQEVVGTNLGTVQPVREALVNALLKASCQFASAITVSDIGIGVLAGGGNLNLEFGGAKALTNNEAASSPFGPGSSPFGASTGSNSALGNTGVGAGLTGNSGAALTTSGLGNTGSTSAASAPASQPKTALGPIERTSQCISLGPSGGGCSTSNLAVPIGLAALALLGTLFTWDYLRQRRRLQLTGGTEVSQ